MQRKAAVWLFPPLVAVGALIGCTTRYPMIEHHEGTYQTQVQALQHWDLMAKEVAAKTAGYLAFTTNSVAIQTAEDSEFLQALGRMLKTELLSNRMRVTETPDTTLTLTVETQLIQHRRDWHREFRPNPTTTSGAIGYSVDAMFSGREVGSRKDCQSELLVVSVVREQGVPKMAVKQVVYISPGEEYLYVAGESHREEGVTLKVTE